jgi:hypothetical protein
MSLKTTSISAQKQILIAFSLAILQRIRDEELDPIPAWELPAEPEARLTREDRHEMRIERHALCAKCGHLIYSDEGTCDNCAKELMD